MSARLGSNGEIFDRGYLHYSGPRLGQWLRRLGACSLLDGAALGIRRSWTAKIIPMLLYAAVAIPVLIAIGIRAFLAAFEFSTTRRSSARSSAGGDLRRHDRAGDAVE